MQARSKWYELVRYIRVVDVIVSDGGISRTRWPIGRVMEVYRWDNNLFRIADDKTAEEIIQRDVRELCIIEGTDEYSQVGGCGSLKAW